MKEHDMKHLAYATIASDDRTVQVSTWKQPADPKQPLGPEEWGYRFKVNGETLAEGTIPDDDAEPVDQRRADADAALAAATTPAVTE